MDSRLAGGEGNFAITGFSRYNTGMLYLVATPIGNLGDISLRALEVLRGCQLILAEDTRHTSILLKHYEISKPQLSFHEHNERERLPEVLHRLRRGEEIALVTDGGTPGISDPGYTLVRACIEENLPFTAIPGAAAFVMALTLSGLPMHRFCFHGFPPHKGGPRRRFLTQDADSVYTQIYYESPFRLADFLNDALAVFGERPAAVANDLTKFYEEVRRGSLVELVEWVKTARIQGEYCVVIGGKPESEPGNRKKREKAQKYQRAAKDGAADAG